jgi:hypothetical protein
VCKQDDLRLQLQQLLLLLLLVSLGQGQLLPAAVATSVAPYATPVPDRLAPDEMQQQQQQQLTWHC